MTGIEDRIAAVIDDHWPSGGGNFCEGCDWPLYGGTGTWPEHVAAAVVAELRLQPEWAIRCGKNVARIGITEENAKAKAAMYPDSFEAVFRTATEWELS